MIETGELPDLIVTSKSQSQETIDAILKGQGYEVNYANTATDEAPPVESEEVPAEPETTEVVPAAPAAAEVPFETPPEPTEPVATEPPTPGQPHKKPGSRKYKEQRDQARIELEALKLRDADRLAEIQDLKSKLAEAPVSKTPPAVTDTPPPTETPKAELPERPKLVLPKFVEPKLEDPDIGDDWDKWQAARTKAQDEHQDAVAKANEEYADKVYDWKEEIKSIKQKEQQSEADRQAAANKEAEQAQQREQQTETSKIMESGNSRYEKFEETVNKKHDKIVCSLPMLEAIRRIGRENPDASADMSYWIATHPDEANLLAKATLLPEKDGRITATDADWDKQMRKVYIEFGKISATLTPPVKAEVPPAGDEPDEEDEEAVEEPVVTPSAPPAVPAAEVPPATPPAAPAVAPTTGKPPVKKPQPASPVGNRGGAGYRTLKQMSAAEIQAMNPDEYRKRYETGEMN